MLSSVCILPMLISPFTHSTLILSKVKASAVGLLSTTFILLSETASASKISIFPLFSSESPSGCAEIIAEPRSTAVSLSFCTVAK